MPNFSGRAEKQLKGRLGDDETFVFAGVVQPKGSISRAASDGTGFVRAVHQAVREQGDRVDRGQLADSVPASNGYLAVTTRRLVWLNQGATGWPTEQIVATWDRDDVGRADVEKSRGLGGRTLIIEFADGSAVRLHVHRSQKPELIAQAINENRVR